MRYLKKPTRRGIIYDRNLYPIVENIPSLAVYLDLTSMKDKEDVAEFLSKNLLIPKEEILQKIHTHRFIKFAPILIAYNIKMETAICLEENKGMFPSLKVKSESRRYYPSENHFIGCVGKISKEEYISRSKKGYSPMDYIGKTGLEDFYEGKLKGKKGYDVLKVDATGTYLGLTKDDLSSKSIHGEDLVLTIDRALQKKVNKILPADSSCVAIVLNCKTGGLLAAVSKPSYDQNIFISGMSEKNWQNLINNEKKPLLNKICNATYPPGSVFKPLVVAYALENEIVRPDEILVDCKGGMEFGGRFFGCWKKEGHGKMDLLGAIRESCDTYFYELAKSIKLKDFKKFLEKCGVLDKPRIDLNTTRSGFFPTTEWYNKNYGKYGWSKGNILNLSIGQGEVLLTPLSLAQFYAGLANKGKYYTPHFLDYRIQDGTKQEKIQYEKHELPIKTDNIKFLIKALDRAVNAKKGTGQLAKINGVRIGGKTGSAENYEGDTHSWFVALAPINDAEIVVLVFVENGGSGAVMAASLTAKIMAQYFDTETYYKKSEM